jgi:L-lactate utilization protein LutB
MILESYKDWKNDVVEMKKESLEKIDRLLKNLNQKGENNLWI